MKKGDKKGLALSTVVGLIILILGFIILLAAFTSINWTGQVDREVCHQSVVYRGTLPEFAGMKDYVPLKCQTNKICISSGLFSGNCNEFLNVKGVSTVKVRDTEDIEKIIAREILTCWQTMGEGKIGIFNDWFTKTWGFGTVASSCVICTRIAFDKVSLEKSGINLSLVNVRNYMITHKVPNKDVSYFVYMTGNAGLLSIKENDGKTKLDEVVSTGKNTSDIKTEDIEVSDDDGIEDNSGKELSVMFMQVQAPQYKDVLKNNMYTLLGIGGGGFVTSPKYTVKAVTTLGKSPWFWAIVAIAGIFQYGSVVNNQAITAGYCGDVNVGDKSTTGCSVVRTVNYGAEDLSKYCSKVESIP